MTTTQAVAPDLTARRVLRGNTTKIVVTVGDNPDAVLAILGGKRADRASAVIVTQWPDRPTFGVYGARADLHAAQAEAHRLVHQDHMITRGRHGLPGQRIPLNTCEWAVAVPVQDVAS